MGVHREELMLGLVDGLIVGPNGALISFMGDRIVRCIARGRVHADLVLDVTEFRLIL